MAISEASETINRSEETSEISASKTCGARCTKLKENDCRRLLIEVGNTNTQVFHQD
jgi:hypothetical protein